MLRFFSLLFVTLVSLVAPSYAQNNWSPVAGALSGGPVTSLAVSAAGNIFAGITGVGVFRSSDGGASWVQLTNPPATKLGPVYGFNYQFNSSGDLFVGGGFGLFRSTDNGNTWTQKRIQPTVGTDPVILSYTMTTWGDMFLASNGSTIWQSKDNGETWIEDGINDDITLYPSFVTCSPTGVLFAATEDAVYRTSKRGNSIWETVGGAFGSNISMAFNNEGTEIIAGGNKGMFRSYDNGTSWTALSPPGMTSSTYFSLAITTDEHVFEGTQSFLHDVTGVSLSGDSGKTWSDLSSGLTTNYVYAYAISRSGIVYAATDNGVFQYAQATGGVKQITDTPPSSFELGENYPNPFSSTTTLHFSIPTATNVSLKVFDVTGREVAVLTNQNYQPGSYQVTFDGKGLHSGTYFCCLAAGGFSQTRALELLP